MFLPSGHISTNARRLALFATVQSNQGPSKRTSRYSSASHHEKATRPQKAEGGFMAKICKTHFSCTKKHFLNRWWLVSTSTQLKNMILVTIGENLPRDRVFSKKNMYKPPPSFSSKKDTRAQKLGQGFPKRFTKLEGVRRFKEFSKTSAKRNSKASFH